MESTAISSSAWASVMDALTAQLSVATVVEVLAVVVGATVGFAFMWWGVRFAIRKIMKAVKTGQM